MMALVRQMANSEYLRRRQGFTFIEIMVVFVVIMILLALLLPAIRMVQDAARRTQCLNNLYQIGIGLQNYQMAFNVYPPGSVNRTGPVKNIDEGYHMSWIAQMTPMLEQQVVFQQTDFSSSAYSSTNSVVAAVGINVLWCPTADTVMGSTSYAGCAGGSDAPLDVNNNGVLFLNSSIRQKQISDGCSNTIVVGERMAGDVPNGQELGWISGTSSTLRQTGISMNGRLAQVASSVPLDLQLGGFNSPHTNNTMQVGLADGSGRAISEAIALDVWQSLGNRSDGNLPNF